MLLSADVGHCWTCLALRVRITADTNVHIITTRDSSSESKNLLADRQIHRTAKSWQLLDRTFTAMRWLLRATSRSRKRRALQVRLSFRL